MSVVINLDKLLVPRLTTTERDAITAVNGMYIYNVTTNEFQGFENSAWTDAVGGGVTADQSFDSIILDIANMDVTLNRAGAGIAQFTVALDVASQELLRLQSTRATRANLDEVFIGFYQPNSVGTLFEFTRLSSVASGVTGGNESGAFQFDVSNASGLVQGLRVDGNFLSVIVNDDAGDFDFRCEGTSETHLLVADAGRNVVSIGGPPQTNQGQLQVEVDTDEVSSEMLRLRSVRATRADNDEVYLSFFQPNSIGVQVETHRFISRLTDVTSGTEDTILRIQANRNGSLADMLNLGRLADGTPRFGILGSEASIQTYTSTGQASRDVDSATTIALLQDVVQTLVDDLVNHGVFIGGGG